MQERDVSDCLAVSKSLTSQRFFCGYEISLYKNTITQAVKGESTDTEKDTHKVGGNRRLVQVAVANDFREHENRLACYSNFYRERSNGSVEVANMEFGSS